MNCNARLVLSPQTSGNEAADISSLSDVLVEAEIGHERIHDACCVILIPVFIEWPTFTEWVAIKRSDDDVIWKLFGRVFLLDQIEHRDELDEASRPAMHEYNRNRVFLLREQGNEVRVEPFNLHGVIWKTIDVFLLSSPVVLVQPVVFGFGKPFVSDAEASVFLSAFPCVGTEFGQLEKLFEVRDLLVWDTERERLSGTGRSIRHCDQKRKQGSERDVGFDDSLEFPVVLNGTGALYLARSGGERHSKHRIPFGEEFQSGLEYD